MKIFVLVPMHNYAKGVVNIINWFDRSEVLAQHDCTLRVFDDHSDQREVDLVNEKLLGDPAVRTFPLPETCRFNPCGWELRSLQQLRWRVRLRRNSSNEFKGRRAITKTYRRIR